MKTPFTESQFFTVFSEYNTAVFPVQLFLLFIAGFSIFQAIRPGNNSARWISGMLALLWLWMGVVYHLIFFTRVNPVAYGFGAAFVLQALLLSYFGKWKKQLSFQLQKDRFGITAAALFTYALIIYPIWGYLNGHIYPASPTFGLPCPTTLFTFGMFLSMDKRCPTVLLIIPALWSIVGFSAVLNFGVKEDAGLLAAALISVPMILIRNKRLTN